MKWLTEAQHGPGARLLDGAAAIPRRVKIQEFSRLDEGVVGHELHVTSGKGWHEPLRHWEIMMCGVVVQTWSIAGIFTGEDVSSIPACFECERLNAQYAAPGGRNA